MKKLLQISLGIVTSVGGFLDAGLIATAAQAGAAFGFQLIWSIVLGTICLVFLVEMSGRFAIASNHTIADGIRERFGFNLFLLFLVVNLIVNLMVLAAELGGIALALQLLTGASLAWWAVPVTLGVWLLLWRGSFGLIENGVSLLGLVALSFVVAAVLLDPPWSEVARGALPTLPKENGLHYGFIAVSILGAVISPYLFIFYSSGAIEEQWDKSYFGLNRAIAIIGMTFGAVISLGVLIVAALIFPPRGIENLESYDQIAMMLTPVLGSWGFYLFALSLGITCFGATLEVALAQAYLVAQGLGWNWSENAKPRDAPAFSLVYTGSLLLAALPLLLGADPLQVTVFSMAITAASLPFGVIPFLILMNDPHYVGEHRNSRIENAVVLFVIGLAFLLSVITVPLQIFGG